MRLYLDSAPVIYGVQNVQPYAAAVRRRLEAPGADLITSELTRLECRVKPIRERAETVLAAFDSFFETAIQQRVSISVEVIDLATEIRATYGFGTPDSIHLAAAVTAGCDVFFTNDHRLDRFDRIRIEVVER